MITTISIRSSNTNIRGRFGIVERNMITDHGTLRISIMLALRSIKRPIASRDAGIVA